MSHPRVVSRPRPIFARAPRECRSSRKSPFARSCGPTPSNTAAANPAIGSLLVDGWLQPDELGLGVVTDAHGRPVDAAGAAVADLFVVGTLRKPALWESTAVLELRVQAAEARRLAVALLQGNIAMATHLGGQI